MAELRGKDSFDMNLFEEASEPPFRSSRRVREQMERASGRSLRPEVAEDLDNALGAAISELRYGSPEEQNACPLCKNPIGTNRKCDACVEFASDAAAERHAEEYEDEDG